MKTIALGVGGAGPSRRGELSLQVRGGIHYLEVTDRDTGARTRVARIALSPDVMLAVGQALVALSDGASLDDVDRTGGSFSRVTKSAV